MSHDGPFHRKRCKRYDIPGHAHYQTFSCLRRQAFLAGPRAPQWLIGSIQAARVQTRFDLWAFVFMPEHVHLLLAPHEGVSVSAILRAVKEPVTKAALRWVRKSRPEYLVRMKDLQPSGKCSYRFWQRGGGYDRNLWTPQEIWEKVEYIHHNPVRRGLVEHPKDWPWSSWKAWHEGLDEPIPIDRDSIPPLR